ncbi:PstS family phosphate ABC transporter substrate-binding protein [Persicimonas caeni]|uniref:Phosphate-binding protein n=1 Tax=Persicimonas caeni TaxID=2292766 RepID=A0A4Y6PXM4_PERCE|nr:PstS family phosphate ABC transporter substrate-binding protein [Persicimonas caeni]QDG52879.1 PstS family phosphate ABC transporter substrate-binding protein [Persicimonas caeni]QED34101.1 PstS family phosphate ABC transporter substrate-binding protein [Persicimonas caeni]
MKLKTLLTLLLAAGLITAAGCKNDNGEGGEAASDDGSIIKVDGSSTVYPIQEAMAEEFQKNSDARVTIGVSGTGGGFQKFCNKETVLTGASRPVKQSEIEKCKKAGVEFVELPVAYDGITVIIHPDNDWADTMTVDELNTIWGPEAQGKITKWSQVRDGWPDQDIQLFAPGTASGTFDYFTQAINGEEQASRGDFSPSEDDHVIVTGVSRSKNALGFLGYAYYDENRDKLKAVEIKASDDAKAVAPSMETIANGTYTPLSRPLFIYVRKDALENNKHLKDFIDFYMTKGSKLVKEVGFIPLPEKAYTLAKERADSLTTGTVFTGGSKVGVTVEELLKAEGGDEAAEAAPAEDGEAKAEADGKNAAEGTKAAAEENAEAGDKAEKAAKAEEAAE